MFWIILYLVVCTTMFIILVADLVKKYREVTAGDITTCILFAYIPLLNLITIYETLIAFHNLLNRVIIFRRK